MDGAGLVKSFNASPAGGAAAAVMQELTTPVPGQEIFSFASPYARSFGVQLYTVLAGGVLETSTRPTLNRRAESARLCEHSPSDLGHSRSDLGSSACAQ